MEKEIEFNLIEQSAKGNTEAFRALVEANQAFAISLASRFVRDISDAGMVMTLLESTGGVKL
jgi:hypothetical protein